MTQRIEKWDILKFFLMFFVVLGHIADCYTAESESMRSLYLFIYSFHMPLFIFLAGLFAKGTIDNKRYSKMFGFLLMYVFSKVLFALYGIINTGKFSINFVEAAGLPWYMLAMFAFMLITTALRNIKPSYVITISVIFALLVGYDTGIRDVLAVSRIIVFFPFFYLGYLVNPESLQKITDKKWIKVLSVLVILIAVALVFGLGEKAYTLRPIFTARNPYTLLKENENIGALVRLFCYCVSAILGFAFIAVTPNKTPFGIIAKFGSRTLTVYVLHYIVIYLLYNQLHIKDFFESLFSGRGAGLMILPLAMVLTVVLSLKPFSVPINAIMKIPQKSRK